MGMFAKAKTLEVPKAPKAKSEKIEIQMSELQDLCEIRALMTSLDAAAKSIEANIKAAGFKEFVKIAAATGIKPENFRGVDRSAHASVELRKRGTNSALNEDEIAVLKKLNITPFEQVITQGLFAINPMYATDSTLLSKVEKALAKIVPVDFIVEQPEVKKSVVTDEMLAEGFKLRHPAAIEIMTTMALKPALNEDYDMNQLFANVQAILEPAVTKKVALPKAKKA